ncbi:hypothetical protein [Rhizorhabdus dicambivorans]|uniref:Uncharacterized protein n=1 Tax=Rhizorhabdus dicambivorans TaxID=1850238 RepID=A0A2A4FWW2_9SPHN|nr:hypothetical protein [Rhizorhabdus dicambivorans]ATE65538.1 hypothetical protein CMV14_14950 [Rhizorhabdus dicambivorans]PCE41881.1 hypothetical protein COO09_12705 [Rhizorhabdus dicambivorans]
MAYLGFSPLDGESRTATASDAGQFSPTELRGIGLAERSDATREIAPHSRLGRFAEWAFGIRLARPLADPRLESLRHFASLARHHAGAVDEADVRHFVDAGYSQGQAFGLLAYLGGAGRQTHG